MAAKNVVEKILASHVVDGTIEPGREVGVKVDRVLMQDATGTMACLEFEALGIPSPRVEHAAIYVDHNVLQTGFENPDDHRFLQSFAAKHGIFFSRPGNGICHQVNLERFSAPGKILLGSDSHTPTAGGAGMMGLGVGGLDVAVAMAGQPFYMTMPRVMGVRLTGRLRPWVTAKDIILEMLRRLSVKGGVGRIFEYFGPGVKTLSVPERSTVTNMGAELGATTSLFPSDQVTRDYFVRQGRGAEWAPLEADQDADYDEQFEIDLDGLEPMIATPSSPDNVKPVADIAGIDVDQVLIGSCTNSSFHDLMVVSHVLKGRTIDPRVSFAVNPGSRQVLQTLIRANGLDPIITSGGRILENACQGCIGMGSAPGTDWVSVRSYNRNFPGRSGTPNDRVYLASPETCVACAVNGEITDPRELGEYPGIEWPERFVLDDGMVLLPTRDPSTGSVLRGPNIKPFPTRGELGCELSGEVLIKVGDNVSTDSILPGGAEVLPLRSNIPAISRYVFRYLDPDFPARAEKSGGGIIVGGANYGQGSSREHAALAPMFLGVRAVLAKSYARIHRSNLVNFGIIPFIFQNPPDYDQVHAGDNLTVRNIRDSLVQRKIVADVAKLDKGESKRPVKEETSGSGVKIPLTTDLTSREMSILLAGGMINFAKRETGRPR
jgi:aconitate hydratase